MEKKKKKKEKEMRHFQACKVFTFYLKRVKHKVLQDSVKMSL